MLPGSRSIAAEQQNLMNVATGILNNLRTALK